MRLALSDKQAQSLERWVTIEAGGKLESSSVLNDNPDDLLADYSAISAYVRLVEGLRAGDVPSDTLDIAMTVLAEWVSNYESGVAYANRQLKLAGEGDPLVLEGKSKEDREEFYREEAAVEQRQWSEAAAIHDVVLAAVAAVEEVI